MAIWTWRKGTFSPREWGWQSPFNPRAAGPARAVGGREPSLGSWHCPWARGNAHGFGPKGWPPGQGASSRPEVPAAFQGRASQEGRAPGDLGDLGWCARPLEAAETLCGSTALSRPGNDRPPPGGRAPGPEPGGGFQRGVRRRPLSAPCALCSPRTRAGCLGVMQTFLGNRAPWGWESR